MLETQENETNVLNFVAFNSMAHLAFEVWKETVFWMLNIN